ncbi:hypothetical protein MPSEU_000652600 [Mayamaea pseudoterrestris]|nr:hypothetical protein MPSEU_000652600 [Mayamaea pseudoterrestris]
MGPLVDSRRRAFSAEGSVTLEDRILALQLAQLSHKRRHVPSSGTPLTGMRTTTLPLPTQQSATRDDGDSNHEDLTPDSWADEMLIQDCSDETENQDAEDMLRQQSAGSNLLMTKNSHQRGSLTRKQTDEADVSRWRSDLSAVSNLSFASPRQQSISNRSRYPCSSVSAPRCFNGQDSNGYNLRKDHVRKEYPAGGSRNAMVSDSILKTVSHSPQLTVRQTSSNVSSSSHINSVLRELMHEAGMLSTIFKEHDNARSSNSQIHLDRQFADSDMYEESVTACSLASGIHPSLASTSMSFAPKTSITRRKNRSDNTFHLYDTTVADQEGFSDRLGIAPPLHWSPTVPTMEGREPCSHTRNMYANVGGRLGIENRVDVFQPSFFDPQALDASIYSDRMSSFGNTDVATGDLTPKTFASTHLPITHSERPFTEEISGAQKPASSHMTSNDFDYTDESWDYPFGQQSDQSVANDDNSSSESLTGSSKSFNYNIPSRAASPAGSAITATPIYRQQYEQKAQAGRPLARSKQRQQQVVSEPAIDAPLFDSSQIALSWSREVQLLQSMAPSTASAAMPSPASFSIIARSAKRLDAGQQDLPPIEPTGLYKQRSPTQPIISSFELPQFTIPTTQATRQTVPTVSSTVDDSREEHSSDRRGKSLSSEHYHGLQLTSPFAQVVQLQHGIRSEAWPPILHDESKKITAVSIIEKSDTNATAPLTKNEQRKHLQDQERTLLQRQHQLRLQQHLLQKQEERLRVQQQSVRDFFASDDKQEPQSCPDLSPCMRDQHYTEHGSNSTEGRDNGNAAEGFWVPKSCRVKLEMFNSPSRARMLSSEGRQIPTNHQPHAHEQHMLQDNQVQYNDRYGKIVDSDAWYEQQRIGENGVSTWLPRLSTDTVTNQFTQVSAMAMRPRYQEGMNSAYLRRVRSEPTLLNAKANFIADDVSKHLRQMTPAWDDGIGSRERNDPPKRRVSFINEHLMSNNLSPSPLSTVVSSGVAPKNEIFALPPYQDEEGDRRDSLLQLPLNPSADFRLNEASYAPGCLKRTNLLLADQTFENELWRNDRPSTVSSSVARLQRDMEFPRRPSRLVDTVRGDIADPPPKGGNERTQHHARVRKDPEGQSSCDPAKGPSKADERSILSDISLGDIFANLDGFTVDPRSLLFGHSQQQRTDACGATDPMLTASATTMAPAKNSGDARLQTRPAPMFQAAEKDEDDSHIAVFGGERQAKDTQQGSNMTWKDGWASITKLKEALSISASQVVQKDNQKAAMDPTTPHLTMKGGQVKQSTFKGVARNYLSAIDGIKTMGSFDTLTENSNDVRAILGAATSPMYERSRLRTKNLRSIATPTVTDNLSLRQPSATTLPLQPPPPPPPGRPPGFDKRRQRNLVTQTAEPPALEPPSSVNIPLHHSLADEALYEMGPLFSIDTDDNTIETDQIPEQKVDPDTGTGCAWFACVDQSEWFSKCFAR